MTVCQHIWDCTLPRGQCLREAPADSMLSLRADDGGLTNFIPLPPVEHGVRVCCFASKQITRWVADSHRHAARSPRQECAPQRSVLLLQRGRHPDLARQLCGV